jgi:hypothetical protein
MVKSIHNRAKDTKSFFRGSEAGFRSSGSPVHLPLNSYKQAIKAVACQKRRRTQELAGQDFVADGNGAMLNFRHEPD